MGRGNSRPGDATYYVDYNQFACFFCDENGNDTEERDYDCEADYVNDYIYNIQYDTNLLQYFTRETTGKKWYDTETRIIADNKYYSIVVFDNEWSIGFSLIRKDFWDEHSWYDYAPVFIEYCINQQIELTGFSAVISERDFPLVDKYKDLVKIFPSVYSLSAWDDVTHIQSVSNKINRSSNIYFNGLHHSNRGTILNFLKQNLNFCIKDRTRAEDRKMGFEYFNEASNYSFGLSLNGAAHICFRDLELAGMNILNLRQPLNCRMHIPFIRDVHYLDFLDHSFVNSIIRKDSNSDLIEVLNAKVEELHEFSKTDAYKQILHNGKSWYEANALPENQFKIIFSFLQDMSLLD